MGCIIALCVRFSSQSEGVVPTDMIITLMPIAFARHPSTVFRRRYMTQTDKTQKIDDIHTMSDDALIAAAKNCIRERFSQNYDSITSAQSAKDYLQVLIGDYDHEVFYALWLDNQHKIIDHGILFTGSINSAMIYPREVVKAGLYHNAAAVIFAHYVARHIMSIMLPTLLCSLDHLSN